MTTAPQKRTPAGGPASAEQTSANADIVAQSEAECKARRDAADKHLNTLRARFALRGFALHIVGPEQFLVSRWGLCREIDSLAALEAFAVQVGARAAA